MDGYAAHRHAPANAGRPGALRSLPVRLEKTEAAAAGGLRNPLTTPQPKPPTARCTRKRGSSPACCATRCWGAGAWRTDKDGALRAARPGDVMALVRKRTHLHLYERELEAAGIPFITSRRGGLLHALEAQDVIALIETLLLPHADLKLAHVLKSPVFGCSDDELLRVFAPEPRRRHARLGTADRAGR
jgi:ATP-dependent helicase/nuclease subunit A